MKAMFIKTIPVLLNAFLVLTAWLSFNPYMYGVTIIWVLLIAFSTCVVLTQDLTGEDVILYRKREAVMLIVTAVLITAGLAYNGKYLLAVIFVVARVITEKLRRDNIKQFEKNLLVTIKKTLET